MSRLLLLAIVFVSACDIVAPLEVYDVTDGPLRMTVTDAPSQMGVAQLVPTHATVTQSTVSVTSARSGSSCQYATTGHADVGASSITLVVTFAQRPSHCVNDIRLLTYQADISGVAKGTYDLVVIHDDSGIKHTVLSQKIVVP